MSAGVWYKIYQKNFRARLQEKTETPIHLTLFDHPLVKGRRAVYFGPREKKYRGGAEDTPNYLVEDEIRELTPGYFTGIVCGLKEMEKISFFSFASNLEL